MICCFQFLYFSLQHRRQQFFFGEFRALFSTLTVLQRLRGFSFPLVVDLTLETKINSNAFSVSTEV